MGKSNKYEDIVKELVADAKINVISEDIELEENDVTRLSQGASAVMNMFMKVFATDKGIDVRTALLYSAGLAGYAAHKAVKETDEALFTVVETANGCKYYFGQEVNKYIFDSKYSFRSCCEGMFMKEAPGAVIPDVEAVAKKVVETIGNPDYLIDKMYKPQEIYTEVQKCWNSIYQGMIALFCKKPSEWPVMFSIVASNMMKRAMNVAPKEDVYLFATEVACHVSKMDDDSIAE